MSRLDKLRALADDLGPVNPSLEKKTVPELLVMHAATEEELRRRKVLRSANNPTGDLAEFLFCRAFEWELASKSAKGYDAIGFGGTKIQIKGRRLNRYRKNVSRQLSGLRNLEAFDVLAAVLLNKDYRVFRAALIPVSVVRESSKFHSHTNSYRFLLRNSVWEEPRVKDVTERLRLVEEHWNDPDA